MGLHNMNIANIKKCRPMKVNLKDFNSINGYTKYVEPIKKSKNL